MYNVFTIVTENVHVHLFLVVFSLSTLAVVKFPNPKFSVKFDAWIILSLQTTLMVNVPFLSDLVLENENQKMCALDFYFLSGAS